MIGIEPSHIKKTGTKIIPLYKLQSGKFATMQVYSGGFGFVGIYSRLKKTLPEFNMPFFSETKKKYIVDFSKVYFIDRSYFKNPKNLIINRFDIKKAYFSILRPFFQEKDIVFFEKQKKTSFLKAVGYSAYSRKIISLETYETEDIFFNDRPDILNFCVTFLSRITQYLMKNNAIFPLVFNYVDSYAFENNDFSLNIDKKTLSIAFMEVYMELLTELQLKPLREPVFDFHFDIMKIDSFTTSKGFDTLNLQEMKNEKNIKQYHFKY
jgi:hypothetical protein